MIARIAAWLSLAAAGAAAQAQLSFEVASIHPHASTDGLTNRFRLGEAAGFERTTVLSAC
jgi:hypothetical protein